MPEVGRHLMIGWLGLEETRSLAAKNAIAGVFLTHRDFPEGASIADIRNIVDQLQAARRQAGLPALWIATDQEGGPVEKLSPPLPRQPPLARQIAGLDRDGIIFQVRKYADEQGRFLADAGINMNFAPVVDLMPNREPGALDLHSRIARRALSADPEIVLLAAQTYVTTMEKYGVRSILKHFPGLGSVPEDTHHFVASLDVPADELASRDWLPFRNVTSTTSAGIMLGHVKLTALDPDNPASCSRAIVHDLLRKQWNSNATLVTDDFSMTPIFHGKGGITVAAEKSMNAGIDIILLSYDAEAVYDLLANSIRLFR
jgi:beta-N-acetylhexosaminidase